MDFAVKRPLVRRQMPLSGFCSSGRDCRSPLLSDLASRRRPCGSLALHLHQVARGTCTPRLSNMLGTRYCHPSLTGRPKEVSKLEAEAHGSGRTAASGEFGVDGDAEGFFE